MRLLWWPAWRGGDWSACCLGAIAQRSKHQPGYWSAHVLRESKHLCWRPGAPHQQAACCPPAQLQPPGAPASPGFVSGPLLPPSPPGQQSQPPVPPPSPRISVGPVAASFPAWSAVSATSSATLARISGGPVAASFPTWSANQQPPVPRQPPSSPALAPATPPLLRLR